MRLASPDPNMLYFQIRTLRSGCNDRSLDFSLKSLQVGWRIGRMRKANVAHEHNVALIQDRHVSFVAKHFDQQNG
jgi:hypothetical protein